MPWITIDEAGSKLGVSRRSIERLLSEDQLPSMLGNNDEGRSVRLIWFASGETLKEDVLIAKVCELSIKVDRLAKAVAS